MPRGVVTHKKNCAICGEEFLPSCPANKICNKDHFIDCPICGHPMIWNSTRIPEPCSKECRREATRRKNRYRWGVDHPMKDKSVQKKHKESVRDHYGVDSPLQSPEIKSKAMETNQKKFGHDWAMQSSDIVEKHHRTMKERYGRETTLECKELSDKFRNTLLERYSVDNAMKSQQIRNEQVQTLVDRYGVDNPMKHHEFAIKSSYRSEESRKHALEESKKTWMKTLGVDNPSKSKAVMSKIDHTFIKRYGVKRAMCFPEFRYKYEQTMIDRYGVPYGCMLDSCNSGRNSKVNDSFAELLDSHGIKYQKEFRLDEKFFDFMISDQNTLVEIDPTYTHNTIGNHWNTSGLDSKYHRGKTYIARRHGYRCIHVFDWDDKDKIVDSLVRHHRLYARNLLIKKIGRDEADEFFECNHFKGTCKGIDVSLGLINPEDLSLVEVISFGIPRYNRNYDYELLRLASKSGIQVVGGASKLFKHSLDVLPFASIISYCELSKFAGNVYKAIGMSHVRNTEPQEVWSKGHSYITANLLRSRGFDQLFGTSYGKDYSNDLLMLENGWLPVYDCGQSVYEYRRE